MVSLTDSKNIIKGGGAFTSIIKQSHVLLHYGDTLMKLFISVCLSSTLFFIQHAALADSTESFHGFTEEDSSAFHYAAMDVLSRKTCHKKFRKYIKIKAPKAFAFNIDPRGGRYVCIAVSNKKDPKKSALDF